MNPVDDVSSEEIVDAVSGRNAGLLFGSFLVGAGLGAGISFLISRRILETKYNQITEEEIAVMREHYQSKLVALENTAGKSELEAIVRDQGYSNDAAPPMAVAPPTAVVEAAEEAQNAEAVLDDEEDEPAETGTRNVFEDAQVVDNWDYHRELTKRSPVRPYVIHMDEREERPFDEVTLTYYEGDDVLCNEMEEALSEHDRERMVGEKNLERFGHGSNSPDVVYIRNDKLEAQFEIIRSPNSYAQEVHGFEHADTRRRRRERLSDDDE